MLGMYIIYEISFEDAVRCASQYTIATRHRQNSCVGRWNYLCEKVIRIILVCSIYLLCVHISPLLESIHIAHVLTPVERFSEQLDSVVSAQDINAVVISIQRIYAEPLADPWNASLSLFLYLIFVCACAQCLCFNGDRRNEEFL